MLPPSLTFQIRKIAFHLDSGSTALTRGGDSLPVDGIGDITGGASSTIGLPETLERTVQKPVNRWNPLQYFELELPRDSQQELQDNPTQAAKLLNALGQ